MSIRRLLENEVKVVTERGFSSPVEYSSDLLALSIGEGIALPYDHLHNEGFLRNCKTVMKLRHVASANKMKIRTKHTSENELWIVRIE